MPPMPTTMPTPGPARPALAYLTSAYARASDSFIRREVAALRALGFPVHTFSVRRPPASARWSTPRCAASGRRRRTCWPPAPLRLLGAALREAARSPRRTAAAAWLALRLGTPGLKGRAWPLAYLLEAAYLAGRLRAQGVSHLHNHIGENSAAVALLAADAGGDPLQPDDPRPAASSTGRGSWPWA